MKSTTTTPTLLFVHGTNFCKEIWRPIERHLKALPLLELLPQVHFVSIDLAYRGSNRDESMPVVVDKETGMAKHPANNLVTLSTDIILREVQRLRAKFGERPIVGIGHSAGASALWNAEVQTPALLAGWCFSSRTSTNPDLVTPSSSATFSTLPSSGSIDGRLVKLQRRTLKT
ncbi:hypothetical protein JG688_00010407 [Phytophthora aleatoria]|uniref:AB hydrolase-1 domain-containing protein n=1 Tax=Phytophthora aleatoria TaxID=2496075 RepID=A0A8J5MFK3_9STRA|nr:hypothetical protein JG688_00010407 [Phytophthora aleatoria]